MQQGVAFSLNGRLLASADDDWSVRLWEGTGATLIVCVRLGVPITALAVHDPRESRSGWAAR